MHKSKILVHYSTFTHWSVTLPSHLLPSVEYNCVSRLLCGKQGFLFVMMHNSTPTHDIAVAIVDLTGLHTGN